MGCRESKLDVVTGNTVTQTKKSKDDSKRIAQPETRPDDKAGGLAAAAEGGDSVTMDGKEGESRELDRENEGSGEEEEDVERSISRESPDHYFSSRKDDEPIEAISTEERSVYSSPPHQPAGKESMKKENLIKESEMETPRAQGLSIEDKFVNPAEI